MANPGNKEKLIEAAQQLAEKGQLDKALREYLKVAAEDEQDVLVWVRIGDLYVKLGQKGEAIANYLRVAQLYLSSSQPDKAISVYQQILQLDPKSADTYMALGELYRDIGKAPLAMQQFELAAQLYGRVGKNGPSLRAEQAVVDLAPESLPRRIRLAELYSKENLPAEAAREFRLAGGLLKKQGRLDDWAKVTERLLFHAPTDTAASNELARHYLAQNDGLKALTRLQTSFKENRQDREQLELLSQAFLRLQKPDKAVAVLKELARLAADRRAAESVFRKVLAIDPNDADAKTALGGGSLPAANVTQSNFTSALILNSPSPGPVPASKTTPLPASANSAGRPTPVAVPAMPARTSSDITPVVGVRLDGTMPPVSRPVEPLSDEEEQDRVLSEADSFVRFGLKGKALESLRATLSHRPQLHKVREKLAKVFESLGQFKPAIAELRTLADRAVSHEEQARYLREILRLDNRDSAASEKLRRISGEFKPLALPPPDEDEPVIEMSASDEDGPTTPNSPVGPRSEPQPLPPAPSGPSSRPSVQETASRQSAPSQRSGTLREELDEVEFFLQQRMLDDARRLLKSLATRYPHSQTVQNKLNELGGAASSSDENLIELEPEEIVSDSNPRVSFPPASAAATAKKAPPLASARSIPVPPSGTSVPSGDKSGPIGEARDPSEAYQRGIAHRNRGQHALAIGEFKVAMQDRKLAGRAALMLNQCYRDLSQLREAVEVFKEGLYMPSVADADLAELNYQLAQCFERLNNPKEAIYFYQQAQQSIPGYKDSAARVSALRR